MNEFLKYISIIKNFIDISYEKERVFYDAGEWYDREASENISLEELEKITLSIVTNLITQNEENRLITDKLYELMGVEEAEKFLDSIS